MENAGSFTFFPTVASSSNAIYAISTLINFPNDTAPFEYERKTEPGNHKRKCSRYHKLYDVHGKACSNEKK